MLTEQEIEQNLFSAADTFRNHMMKKEYLEAKTCYDRTRTIAVAVALDPEKMDKLFGSRQCDPPVEGMFSERMVHKAYEECRQRYLESEAIEEQLRLMRRGSGREGLRTLRKEWQ